MKSIQNRLRIIEKELQPLVENKLIPEYVFALCDMHGGSIENPDDAFGAHFTCKLGGGSEVDLFSLLQWSNFINSAKKVGLIAYENEFMEELYVAETISTGNTNVKFTLMPIDWECLPSPSDAIFSIFRFEGSLKGSIEGGWEEFQSKGATEVGLLIDDEYEKPISKRLGWAYAESIGSSLDWNNGSETQHSILPTAEQVEELAPCIEEAYGLSQEWASDEQVDLWLELSEGEVATEFNRRVDANNSSLQQCILISMKRDLIAECMKYEYFTEEGGACFEAYRDDMHLRTSIYSASDHSVKTRKTMLNLIRSITIPVNKLNPVTLADECDAIFELNIFPRIYKPLTDED